MISKHQNVFTIALKGKDEIGKQLRRKKHFPWQFLFQPTKDWLYLPMLRNTIPSRAGKSSLLPST